MTQAHSTDLDDARWAAVAARDARRDGDFFYCVETTGVYCRPSCPSRPAKRANVRFCATIGEAEALGFRPCRRCRPDTPSQRERDAEKIVRACRMIEAAETAPTLAQLARAFELSPYHFHRVFSRIVGVTPKAYAQARRRARLRDELKESRTVTKAIYESGYNSSARFYATAHETLGMTPSAYRAGAPSETIRFAIGQSSLGAVLVAASAKGVCAISLGDDPEDLLCDLRNRFPREQEDFSCSLVRESDASLACVATVIATRSCLRASRVGRQRRKDCILRRRSIRRAAACNHRDLLSGRQAPRCSRTCFPRVLRLSDRLECRLASRRWSQIPTIFRISFDGCWQEHNLPDLD